MSAKRSAESDSESSDDDDYGPAPVSADAEQTPADTTEIVVVAKKKRRKLKHEKVYFHNAIVSPLIAIYSDFRGRFALGTSLRAFIYAPRPGHTYCCV
jgi:hypothetical protein